MTTRKEHPVEVVDWSPPLRGDDGYVRMTHQSWPGFRFVVSFDSDATVTGFTVERTKDSPMITARALQRIPYGALERQALDLAANWIISYAEGISPSHAGTGLGSGLDLAARAFAENQHPGLQGRRLVWYATAAERYVELVKGGSTSPIRDLAGEMGLSVNRVRNIIFEAREHCLLSRPAKDGVAGGELMKKARELLRQR